jgi:PAS domain S-box-containing protein
VQEAQPTDITAKTKSVQRSWLSPVASAAVAVVALLVLCLLQIVGVLSGIAQIWVNSLALVVGGISVIVSTAVASRRSSERRQRRAWALLCLAGVFATASNAWYAISGARNSVLYHLGDIGFLIGGVCAVFGMATFPTARRRGAELVRFVLDGAVVTGSVLLTVTVVALSPVLEAGRNPFAQLDAISLISIDIILATVAGMLVLRSYHADRPVLITLAAGFGCWAVTDLTRWVLTVNDYPVFSSAVPLGWAAGYAAIAIAARMPQSVGQHAPQNNATPVADTVITFGLLLIAAAATAPSLPAMRSPFVGGLWMLLILAVVLRQLVLIADNERLRHTLERRVATRTRELMTVTQQSELLLNSVGDGIYGVDSRGVITFVNPSAARTLGYSASELIGQHAHDHLHAPRPDGTPYDYQQCYVAEAISRGITTSGEDDLYLAADGSEVPVEVTASPLHSYPSSPGAVVVFRDVTQRREVERMKKEFVSVVSHELRTPLTAIRGSLGLLDGDRLGELTPQARRMVRIALDSSERLGRLVNDILDIDRMESGSMPMDFHDHDVAELLRTAIAQLRPIAADAKVGLSLDYTAGQVMADGDRIVQTLVNLIGNAIKYSPAGSTVRIHAGPAEPMTRVRAGHTVERDMIMFTVADQGRGIPADKLEQVFERFEQVDSSDRREMGGSGLGLSICRSIVERHGGQIWAESPPGSGAIFRFTLPTVRPEEGLDHDQDQLSDEPAVTSVGDDTDSASPEPDGSEAGDDDRAGSVVRP